MMAAFGEGVTQALLPCSWILLVPAVALGVGTRNIAVFGAFAGSVVLTAWITAAGWFAAPVWLAGVAFLVGGLLWWRFEPTWISSVLIGVGSAWAWQPCVGSELGKALTTAQRDPFAAFGGLAMFLLGITFFGVLMGLAIGALMNRWSDDRANKTGAAVAVALGFSMVLGVYPEIASKLAQWSTALWA